MRWVVRWLGGWVVGWIGKFYIWTFSTSIWGELNWIEVEQNLNYSWWVRWWIAWLVGWLRGYIDHLNLSLSCIKLNWVEVEFSKTNRIPIAQFFFEHHAGFKIQLLIKSGKLNIHLPIFSKLFEHKTILTILFELFLKFLLSLSELQKDLLDKKPCLKKKASCG